jgi:hypothetical protein
VKYFNSKHEFHKWLIEEVFSTSEEELAKGASIFVYDEDIKPEF